MKVSAFPLEVQYVMVTDLTILFIYMKRWLQDQVRFNSVTKYVFVGLPQVVIARSKGTAECL